MQELIGGYFLPSDEIELGNLIAFYENVGGAKTLIHTALLVRPEDIIFEQSGIGGIYIIETIGSKIESFNAIGSTVEVKSFRPQ